MKELGTRQKPFRGEAKDCHARVRPTMRKPTPKDVVMKMTALVVEIRIYQSDDFRKPWHDRD